MMSTRRTRQASGASIILSKSKYHRPLLSQVNGEKIKDATYDSRGQEQQGKYNEKRENSGNMKQEPGTDDEPLSSSEEEEEEVKIDSPVQTKKEGATKRKRETRDSPANTKSQKYNPLSDENVHSSFNKRKPKGRTMGYGKSSSQIVGSSQDGFRQPADYKDTKVKSAVSFQVPIDINLNSPPKSQKTHDVSVNIHASSSQSTFRMPAALEDDAPESLLPPLGQFRGPPISASSSALTYGEFDVNSDDDISSLSSPPSELCLAMEELDDQVIDALQADPTTCTDTDGQSHCPNCNAPVDADLLDEFLAIRGRRLRDERLFCERHKAHNAEKEWEDKGYPTIDWHTFEKRVQRHFSELEVLLVPSPSSFFRGRLESAMKAGQGKVFKLSLEEDNMENLSCGYYGPKGASRMLTSVTSQYSRKLRQLAAVDNVLKTAGPTTYAQAVLVPELTVLLIKEDMNVDSQDARQILRDSMDIGNRLNAAEDDRIHLEKVQEEDNGYV